MSEALRTTSLSRRTDLRQILAEDDARERDTLWKDFANSLTEPTISWFGIEWDTVYPIGYQRMGAANPLVGGIAQQDTPGVGTAYPSWMNRRGLY